jgi:intergrase/recombinase
LIRELLFEIEQNRKNMKEIESKWKASSENRKNRKEIAQSIQPLDYWEHRSSFQKWIKANYSKDYLRNNISYLDRYLGEKVIKNQMELFKIVSKVKKGKRHLAVAIRAFLNFLEAFDLMDEESLIRYRKVVKVPRTTLDDYIPEDSKVISVFREFDDERYRKFFKFLAFSGKRAREAIWFFNHFDNSKLIVNQKIAKYPLSSNMGTKKSYYAYLPRDFALELERMKIDEKTASKYFERRGLAPKYLRKWNYNFLILQGVPESVADFIQGRASITVGAMHYLAKVKQADEWYSRIADKLLDFF